MFLEPTAMLLAVALVIDARGSVIPLMAGSPPPCVYTNKQISVVLVFDSRFVFRRGRK